MVVLDCKSVAVGLVQFDITDLELDSAFADCFCLKLGVMEWTSGRIVGMMDTVGGVWVVLVLVVSDG